MSAPEIAPNPDVLATNRGRVGGRYYLMTPDTMVENSLPFLPPYSAVVLAAPQGTPARFGQVLLTLAAGDASTGELGAGFENFLFVIEGEIEVASGEDRFALGEEGYLFLPEGRRFQIRAAADARLLWVKKRYLAIEGLDAPEIVHGTLADVVDNDDEWIDGSYGQCLPDDARYDMAMNIMRFRSGARFRMNEIHHQEKGSTCSRAAGSITSTATISRCAETTSSTWPHTARRPSRSRAPGTPPTCSTRM